MGHRLIRAALWAAITLSATALQAAPFAYVANERSGNISVIDVANGYLITPMEQGIRLTTGAEFAAVFITAATASGAILGAGLTVLLVRSLSKTGILATFGR